MGKFNRNMLNPDNQTNAFVDEFFSFGFFPLINKPTRISTAATLIDNIWTNKLKYLSFAFFWLNKGNQNEIRKHPKIKSLDGGLEPPTSGLPVHCSTT